MCESRPRPRTIPQSDAEVFLARVGEATIDNKNAVTGTDCILVMPDGRFHLERTRQVAPNPTSSLSIFESLDSTQLHQLHDSYDNLQGWA